MQHTPLTRQVSGQAVLCNRTKILVLRDKWHQHEHFPNKPARPQGCHHSQGDTIRNTMKSITLSLDELHALLSAVLVTANVATDSATATATALVAAEADGLASHGASRVPFYADQVHSGKVDGQAVPELTRPADAAIRVDAGHGLAYPAIRLGLDAAADQVAASGVVSIAISHSHHCGAAGYHVERMAERGLIALAFSNSPAAIAPWGGTRGSFGTNPIAFACPRLQQPPLVIDLSLSTVARGKIMQAHQQGREIPETWALDAAGLPTGDPKTALMGTMQPLGGAKGAALALMVELLAGALTGSNLAFQASSFFDATGKPPDIGQLFILFDPGVFNPHFDRSVTALLDHVLAQPGTRLPGDRRLANRQRAQREGVELPEPLYQDLLCRSSSRSR